MRNRTRRNYDQRRGISLSPEQGAEGPELCCGARVAIRRRGRKCQRNCQVTAMQEFGASVHSGLRFQRDLERLLRRLLKN